MKTLNAVVGIIFGSLIANCSAMPVVEEASFMEPSRPEFRTVLFQNPCYPHYSPLRELGIPNGSMLNFASAGLVGKTIRAASAMNAVPNPLGLTHSGIVFNESPQELYNLVLSLTPSSDHKVASMLSFEEGSAILSELNDTYHEDITATYSVTKLFASFSLESDGSASEVLKGIMPHVHIHDLGNGLREYDGNVYIRPINIEITANYTKTFLASHLGRPYESVTKLTELINSVRGGNTKEGQDKVFCSELAGYFYKGVGAIPQINASNIIPELFSSSAGEYDLLRGNAEDDVLLKRMYDFSESDLDGTSCFGRGVQRFFKFFHEGCCCCGKK